MKNEILPLSNDINVITAEINSYKQIAGNAIFEIGKRLKHVKESKMAERHGGWTDWLRHIEMDRAEAHRFITVATELGGSNVETFHRLGLAALNLIATLPPEQREQPHMIPSTGKTKTVDEMTVRELQEVKKALKEAEARRELAEKEADILRDTLESIEDAEPETITEYVEVSDESTKTELEAYKRRFGELIDDGSVVTKRESTEDRKKLYAQFVSELRKVRTNFSSIAFDAKEFLDFVSSDVETNAELERFESFINLIAKNGNKNTTIIEVRD